MAKVFGINTKIRGKVGEYIYKNLFYFCKRF